LISKDIDAKKCVYCKMDIRLMSKFCFFCGRTGREDIPQDIDNEEYGEEICDEEDFNNPLKG